MISIYSYLVHCFDDDNDDYMDYKWCKQKKCWCKRDEYGWYCPNCHRG